MKHNVIKAALAAAICLGGAGAQASIITTDATYGVFDGNRGSRVFHITEHGSITDLNITIDFSKCDNPAIGPNGSQCIGTGRAFTNEIEFRLQGSNGRIVNLVNLGTYSSNAGPGRRVTVTFDDEAAATVGGSLQSGSFRPAGSLAAFDGLDMFGSWTLLIRDAAAGDPLEYFSSTLKISAQRVPEPATLGILGIGLLGLGAARKTRRVGS